MKEFGKQHLFDGRDDTCWNSDQQSSSSAPQWVAVTFDRSVTVSQIELVFQGGFAAKHCRLEVKETADEEEFVPCFDFYPEVTIRIHVIDSPGLLH